MRQETKWRLENLLKIIGLVMGVFGFIGSFAIIPYRMDAAEKAIATQAMYQRVDRELLIRMEEQNKVLISRVDYVIKKLERIQ